MSWILLTNDDGVDSPALVPFARALTRLGDVRVVVPDRERSWVAKAITRFDPVAVSVVERGGLTVHACSGYPADAVQLAVNTLFEEPPSLVVSGINVGYNHGTAYVMSSGTVGAAVEAWVAGVPAVAVSAGTVGDWPTWRAYVHSPDAVDGWRRLAEHCVGLVGRIEASGMLEVADVVVVNLPFDADDVTPVRVTSVARVGYDRLFERVSDDLYSHAYGGVLVAFDDLEGTDVAAAAAGAVAITPLRMPDAAVVPDEVRRHLERG